VWVTTGERNISSFGLALSWAGWSTTAFSRLRRLLDRRIDGSGSGWSGCDSVSRRGRSRWLLRLDSPGALAGSLDFSSDETRTYCLHVFSSYSDFVGDCLGPYLSRLQRISSFSRGSGNCDSALGERGRDSTPPYPRHELYGVGSPLGDLSMLVKDPEKDGFEGAGFVRLLHTKGCSVGFVSSPTRESIDL
jgi:hypothetical protein